jgi:hypothetical protein
VKAQPSSSLYELVRGTKHVHVTYFTLLYFTLLYLAWRPMTRAELSAWENGPLKEANARLDGRDAR